MEDNKIFYLTGIGALIVLILAAIGFLFVFILFAFGFNIKKMPVIMTAADPKMTHFDIFAPKSINSCSG